jgi:hypothetical protein
MSDSAKEEFFDDLKKRGLPNVFIQREKFGKALKAVPIFLNNLKCIRSIYFEPQPSQDKGQHWLAESIYYQKEAWTDLIKFIVKICLLLYEKHGTGTHRKKEWASLGMFFSNLQLHLSKINATEGIKAVIP